MRPFLHTQTHTSVHAHTNMHKTLIFTNITHTPHSTCDNPVLFTALWLMGQGSMEELVYEDQKFEGQVKSCPMHRRGLEKLCIHTHRALPTFPSSMAHKCQKFSLAYANAAKGLSKFSRDGEGSNLKEGGTQIRWKQSVHGLHPYLLQPRGWGSSVICPSCHDCAVLWHFEKSLLWKRLIGSAVDCENDGEIKEEGADYGKQKAPIWRGKGVGNQPWWEGRQGERAQGNLTTLL